MMVRSWRCLPLLCLALRCGAGLAAPLVTDEEFIGPLVGWLDVKSDFGAKGDGEADDTAAIQAGLDAIRPEGGKQKILFFPAGTYRITSTLNLLREKHAESTGISILGEDPATTTIRWDGPADGVMFYYSPWLSRLARLTFDGAGRGLTAVRHGKPFATALEYCDVVFKEVGFGIEAGEEHGIAEASVLRCTFLRCSKAGASMQNWNTLDWWFYTGPPSSILITRMNEGIWWYRSEMTAHFYWHYCWPIGDPWFDFDGKGDYCAAYPGDDGPIATIGWEGVREGLDDLRYFRTLEARVKEAREKGVAEDLADEAGKYLRDLCERIPADGAEIKDARAAIPVEEYGEIRWQVAKHIVALDDALAGRAGSGIARDEEFEALVRTAQE